MDEITESQIEVIKTLYLNRSDKSDNGDDEGLSLQKTLEILLEAGKNITLDELKNITGLFHVEDKRKIYLDELIHYYSTIN